MRTQEPQPDTEVRAAVSPPPPEPSAPQEPLPRGTRSLILVAGLGIFLAALDQTVIVTALWSISTDLGIPVDELDKAAWVITAYLLGYTVALPLMGRVADVYGQKRVFLISLGIFILGSVACALAPGLG
jgi:MFS family permease